MKLRLNELIKEAHGKMCNQKGSPILAYNSLLDVQYAYHPHKVNPRLETPTENMIAKQNKFANTWELVKKAQENATQWAGIVREFKAQSKYKTVYTYAFKKLYPTASAVRE